MSHLRQRIRGLRKRYRALLRGQDIFPRGLPIAVKLDSAWRASSA